MPQELPSDNAQSVTLSHYLAVLRRRKLIIVAALVIVPLAAVLFSLRQERLYQASAEVLLSHQNLAANLTGATDPNLGQQADRVAQTQADLARAPAIATRTLAAAGLSSRSADEFLSSSSVTPKANADLLVFMVTDPKPKLASRLTSIYARQYAVYRSQLDTSSVARAQRGVKQQMDALRAHGQASGRLYTNLADRYQQLREMEALQTSNAYVIRDAGTAVLVQPRTRRNGIIGGLLGLVFGIGLAFLYEALDTRVRTAEEIGRELGGLPLIARLPAPPKEIERAGQLVMLAEPYGIGSEAYRMLRANLDFVSLERDTKTIMVTSSLASEGKTTTAANLALALAHAGRKVILVDLDLRRPRVASLFGLRDSPGLTDVVLGAATLEQAITSVGVIDGVKNPTVVEKPSGPRPVKQGSITVLPSGPRPPSPGEFVGLQGVADLIARLRDRADVVIVDSPPLLGVVDAMVLSTRVDAMIIVARLDFLHQGTLHELARTLGQCPAVKLGFVLAGAEEGKRYGYGYHRYGYGHKDSYGRLPSGESAGVQPGEATGVGAGESE
jgi:Mrp family chromosome partitioning ATPase/capsular polysaccharide biosynthesis protein